jgi:probable HAF family extracellular repeat protein
MQELKSAARTNSRHRRVRPHAQRSTLAPQLAWGLVLALVCQSALGQAMYRIKPIGYLGECWWSGSGIVEVRGLNDADQVVGTACNANGDAHAFLWNNDGKPRVDLGPHEAGATSNGFGINASGLVVGTAQDSTGRFGFVSLGDGKPMKRIYNAWGGAGVGAYAVNDSGQVTGTAGNAPPFDYASSAFLWKDDGRPMRDLDTLNALERIYAGGLAINASGQVTGQSSNNDRDWYAFVWKNDGSAAFEIRLGGYRTSPCCINASGQVAGYSSASGFSHPHAFLWRNDGTPTLDLGTLSRGTLSGANALNDRGQVAGWSTTFFEKRQHAFVWMNDGMPMKDLGTFGGTGASANDINASGQVTGYANLAGDTTSHGFLWRNNGTRKQDLNALIDPLDPLKAHVTVTEGVFVNDRANIVAYGIDSRTGLSSPYFLQGTVLTLAPRSLAFGNQPISTTSAAKPVTVTNTSAKVVAIASITLNGTNAGQFASTNNCPKSLAGYATCTIKVTFKPTSRGAKSAVLNVNGGGSGLRSVTLAGNGT